MGIYEELCVPRIINAMGTFTLYGGSKMSHQTLMDMYDAASSFVDIRLLQHKLSDAIATLTYNEAAYVCSGASAGIYCSFLAALAVHFGKKMRYLKRDDFEKGEIIIFCSHRNPYDIVIDQLGLKIVQIAYANHTLPSVYEDIKNVINENTVAIYYLESGWVAAGAPKMDEVIRVAHDNHIPVIVDAAAMTPPVENLWKYTSMGADLAIFSGGKDIHGPQVSGLIVGKKEYISILLEEAFPVHGYGRMFKIGREEMVGFYSALKQYMSCDLSQRQCEAEEQIAYISNALADCPYYTTERVYPNEAGQPIARMKIKLSEELGTGELVAYLRDGRPPVIVATDVDGGVFINPMSLSMEDVIVICEKLLAFIEQKDII